jgi:hypothetical protein
MTTYRVTDRVGRSTLRRLDGQNVDRSELAEKIGAEAFGYERARVDSSWYDCVSDTAVDTPGKMEVKACRRRLDSGRKGRFRLWEKQTVRIAAADRSPGGVGWFVFVLFDNGDTPQYLRRMHGVTVQRMVDGWNRSGHADRGRQRKVVWDDFLNPPE